MGGSEASVGNDFQGILIFAFPAFSNFVLESSVRQGFQYILNPEDSCGPHRNPQDSECIENLDVHLIPGQNWKMQETQKSKYLENHYLHLLLSLP
jgi:hypothetical protein